MAFYEKSSFFLIASLVGIISLFGILILIFNTPSIRYEISVFTNINPIFLILSALTIFFSIITIFYAVSSNKHNRFLFVGFFILLNWITIVYSLSFIRGYFFFDPADPFTHYAHIANTVNAGHYDEYLIYPALHVFLSEIKLLTGGSILDILKYTPTFFALLFIIFMFIYLRKIVYKKLILFLSLIFVIIPFLHTGYYYRIIPNNFSFFIIPLIIFIYINFKEKKSKNYEILLYLCLCIMPFAHPITTILLLPLLLLLEALYKYTNNNDNPTLNHINFHPFIFLALVFLFWIMSFFIFEKSLNTLISIYFGESTPYIEEIGHSFNKINFSFYDQILLFLKIYGVNSIIFLFAVIGVLLLIKNKIAKDYECKKTINSPLFIVNILMLIIVIGLMMISLFLGDPNFLPLRSINYVFLFTIPLASLGFYKIQKYFDINTFFVTIFLIVLFLLSVVVVYPSPYISQPNLQVTSAQFTGLNWFFENKEESLPGIKLSASVPYRFAEVIYPDQKIQEQKSIGKFNWEIVPVHLGYQEFEKLGSNYNSSRYFPVSESDRISYFQVWKEADIVSPHDFLFLEEGDFSVQKIFDNKDLSLYFII